MWILAQRLINKRYERKDMKTIYVKDLLCWIGDRLGTQFNVAEIEKFQFVKEKDMCFFGWGMKDSNWKRDILILFSFPEKNLKEIILNYLVCLEFRAGEVEAIFEQPDKKLIGVQLIEREISGLRDE